MDERQGKRVLEGLLFVFGRPLALKRLTQILPDLEVATIRQLIHTLNDEYAASERAFLIQEVAGGYQIVTDQELAPWIRRALQSPKPDSVSTATMETLAIIAYRQPITKADIEAIRGSTSPPRWRPCSNAGLPARPAAKTPRGAHFCMRRRGNSCIISA